MFDLSLPPLPRKAGRMPENPKWKDGKRRFFRPLSRHWKDGREICAPLTYTHVRAGNPHAGLTYIFLPSFQYPLEGTSYVSVSFSFSGVLADTLEPSKACKRPLPHQWPRKVDRPAQGDYPMKTTGSSWPYNTTAWRKLRALHLKLHPLCEGCLEVDRYVGANTVDHRTPISQGGAPFPDHAGLASYCPSCHSAKTARGPEAGSAKTWKPRKGCHPDGTPIDRRHPWHEKSLRAKRSDPPSPNRR